jgi:hypothetical protein
MSNTSSFPKTEIPAENYAINECGSVCPWFGMDFERRAFLSLILL